jgi:hypothetical protein
MIHTATCIRDESWNFSHCLVQPQTNAFLLLKSVFAISTTPSRFSREPTLGATSAVATSTCTFASSIISYVRSLTSDSCLFVVLPIINYRKQCRTRGSQAQIANTQFRIKLLADMQAYQGRFEDGRQMPATTYTGALGH